MDAGDTTAGAFVWDSRSCAPGDAFAVFREELGGRLPEVLPEIAADRRGSFRGRLTIRPTAGEPVATLRATAHVVDRGPAQVRTAARPLVVLGLQIAGECLVSPEAGPGRRLAPGDLFVLDGTRPFRIDHRPGRGMEVASMVLPPGLVGAAALRQGGGVLRLSAAPVLGALARDAFRALAGGTAAGTLAAVTQDLIGAIASGGAARPPDAPVEVARLSIGRHCGDPAFGIAACARMLGVSVRSLQRAFAAAGTTFGRDLLDLRLARAEAMLADPARRAGGIAAVAWACGFADLSHFNHAFRARRGCTPGDWRRAAAEGVPPAGVFGER